VSVFLAKLSLTSIGAAISMCLWTHVNLVIRFITCSDSVFAEILATLGDTGRSKLLLLLARVRSPIIVFNLKLLPLFVDIGHILSLALFLFHRDLSFGIGSVSIRDTVSCTISHF